MKNKILTRMLPVYADLSRYRLSLAITISSVTGYFISTQEIVPGFFFMLTGVFMLSSGSSALNQYSEKEPDRQMGRTKNRPLPSGKITPPFALKFSFTLLSLGSVLLFISGIAPFLLGLLTVILYNFLYTSLKKQTVFAIIPGALVGAIPPLIGYSASGISVINHDIIAFSLFMFLWQLPHFWLILIRYGKEYADAGFPTMLNYINEKKIVALVFSWVVLTTIILSFSGIEVFESNLKYPLMILNIGFILLFYRCLFIKNQPRAAFFLVNSFSLVLMLSLIFGAIFPGI